ncbi:hypothetical protein Tco_0487827 [Tanacetum coccineum]
MGVSIYGRPKETGIKYFSSGEIGTMMAPGGSFKASFEDIKSFLPMHTPSNDLIRTDNEFGIEQWPPPKDKCPKAGNQQNNGARGRAYVVVKNPQQNPNVVTGTFILNDHYACILFDSGAEKSFVSFAFTPFIDIAPTALNTSYEIELADGKVVSTNKTCYKLTYQRHCTKTFVEWIVH